MTTITVDVHIVLEVVIDLVSTLCEKANKLSVRISVFTRKANVLWVRHK